MAGFSMHFGGVDAALADIHNIRSDKRTAFQARLKNFLRLGLLQDVKAGRGKAAEYGAGEIYQLSVALELLQFGLSPERAVRLVADSIDLLKNAGRTALTELANQTSGYAMFLVFNPNGLAELSNRAIEDEAIWTLTYGGPAKLRELIPSFIEEAGRAAIMNVSLLIRGVRETLAAQHSPEVADRFVADLEAWFGLFPVEAS